MNFKENESAAKLRGGYYTDPEIASFLLRWVLEIAPKRLLEPSCGDGVFLRALGQLGYRAAESVVGFEIEPDEADKSRAAGVELPNTLLEIHAQDFLGWFLHHLMSLPAFDAVVGNPPFIRYQYLDNLLQLESQRIFEHFQLPFTKHTNAWVPFVVASIALLRPGGRLAMVLPSEILHILHAQSLRTYLTQQCSRVLIFDPEELWFKDTLQGAVLLMAEKKSAPSAKFDGVAIIPTRTTGFLSGAPEEAFRFAAYSNGDTLKGKWMRALLTPREREVLQRAACHPDVSRFGEIAEVAVGIVTGANKFFLIPNAVVFKYGLERWSYPMFGRSEHVPGVIYDEAVHRKNQELGLPTNFIWFTTEQLSELPVSVQNYIRNGEAAGIHKRYKCRIREPWYSVPSVHSTPLAMLKRSHHFPRLILNEVDAFTTDTAYRVRSRKLTETALVFAFVNSLTALTAELEGRHYGGGVLELVPSEIRKLLVPVPHLGKVDITELDNAVRKGTRPEKLLATQDALVLTPLGFTHEECELLRSAWKRLSMRRRRKQIVEPPRQSR
jgi:adenine-specific DNA-methyltransferase